MVITRFCTGKKMRHNLVACESSRESYFKTCFCWRTGTSFPYRYTMVIHCSTRLCCRLCFEECLLGGITRRSWNPHHATKHTCMLRQFAPIFARGSYHGSYLGDIILHGLQTSFHASAVHAYYIHAPCRPQNTVTNSDNRPSDSEVDWSCSG